MDQEADRLAALSAYEVAGVAQGADLDRIVRLVAELLDVPIALVSLVRRDRIVFAARVGLADDGVARDHSFCTHAIQQEEPFLVPDARQDPRFAALPSVAAENGLRFYAGVSLVTPPDAPFGRHRLGTLCVLDRAPRPVPDARFAAVLAGFARIVVDRMELCRVEAERRRTAERLHRAAQHDPLTGLPNRSRLLAALDQGIASGGPAGLVLLDLDNFRQVNETLGRDAGDALLRAVARRLAACLGGRDMLARVGGDDFAVLLPDALPEMAEAMARRLQQCLAEEPFSLRGQQLRAGATAGLACAAAGRAATLLAEADLALLEAKRRGKGSCERFVPRLRAEQEARRQLEEELRLAVMRGEFVLHYQPQVRLGDGALIGVEALLRWQHPRRGLLLPGAFLETLERGPSTALVGDWVIDEACRQAAAWRAAGLAVRVAVNLFVEQLRRGGLARTVRMALARHGLPPGALELELTERIVLHRPEPELLPLRELGAIGVQLALDDFGTGFASLATLKQVPATRLKIDRSFVTELDTDPYDVAIVAAVLALGRSLDLDVIAEGIETEVQERRLIELGCAEAQGYRYGKPMPAAEIARRHRRR